jgi:ribosomal protein L29
MAAKKAVKEAPVVKTIEELRAELVAKQQDLVDATKGHKLGELVNPRVLTITRKEIARLHTAIRAIELAEVKEKK